LDGIFREKGLLQFYAALPNGSQRRANLLKLHDHAIRFEHFRTTEPGAALGRFVEFLEKLDDAQQDWAPAEPDSSSRNAVRVMSIHKSKGLEFPVVFVAAHQVIADRKRHSNTAEEMRILYVALTRAREKLILTGSKKQNACAKLLSQCASGAAEWKVNDARCHLDWILTGFADQSPLHALFETDNEGELSNDGLFATMRVSRECLEVLTKEILDAKRSLKSVTEPPKSASPADNEATKAFEAIHKNLQWAYRYSDITETPAKLSVSELTHRDDEFSAADLRWAFTDEPLALHDSGQTQTTPDALSLGSAVHLILEHIDLSKPVNAEAIQSTVAELVKTGQLTESASAVIDVSGIVSFFDSELGQLAQKAGSKVLREWPFTYALDAAAVGAKTGGETVVLQGIVDMIIPAADGLVIVDFKSDRITEKMIPERAEKYAGQLRLYAQAVTDIFNQPISAAWLYFLTPQKAVKVKL
jgi:ATP-dependent helicase/nuclease subunit A